MKRDAVSRRPHLFHAVSRRPHLFLEQRIAIVRRRLNEETVQLGRAADVEEAIRRFSVDCMNVLDGFDWPLTRDERRRFRVAK